MSKENTVSNSEKGNGVLANIGGSYFRPKTRGELAHKIKEGVPCEVVSSNRKFTAIALDGWLNMEGKYKVRLSENRGWDVYELV